MHAGSEADRVTLFQHCETQVATGSAALRISDQRGKNCLRSHQTHEAKVLRCLTDWWCFCLSVFVSNIDSFHPCLLSYALDELVLHFSLFNY